MDANEHTASVVFEDGSFAIVDAWRIQAPLSTEKKELEDALVAAATRVAPPSEWFENPNLDGVTPLTVDADGRVYGHLADWSSCHIGFANECVTAPESATEYSYFHTGAVETAEGDMLPVGKITLGTGHAGLEMGFAAAAEHYDNSGATVAIVRAGEDAYGIWVAGSVVPEASPERIAELRRSPLSGDWRSIGGNLELVAALGVNTPGFGIPRTRARVASGAPVALVAAGVVQGEQKAENAPQKPAEGAAGGNLADQIGRAIASEFARQRKRENSWKYAQEQFALIDADRREEAATLLALIGGE